MTPERPPSRSERLLRETLDRNPHPSTHRRRHSHATTTTTDDDDQLFRAAFLYRNPATASPHIAAQRSSHSPSPTREDQFYYNYYRHRAGSPSPKSSRRQSLQRSPASSDGQYMSMMTSANLQRHNSTPGRTRSNAATVAGDLPHRCPLPLTPHEQVLRSRLERVLLSGRVVDEQENNLQWGSDHPMLASTPPKSASSSDHGHGHYSYQGHHRSRSKTDPLTSPPLPPLSSPRRQTFTYASTTPVLASPYLAPQHNKPRSPSYYHHPPTKRNNSHSSSTSTQLTPPLTADASPVLGEPHDVHLLKTVQNLEEEDEEDEQLLLTPPPTPPLYRNGPSSTATTTATATPLNQNKRHGATMYRTRTPADSCTDPGSCSRSRPASPSPYMYPYKRRELDVDADVQSLDLSSPSQPSSHCLGTFNARKASERCRMIEGYVSFAAVEGLGLPPDGEDDHDPEELNRDSSCGGSGEKNSEEKRGRGLIGTWARRLFVGVGVGVGGPTTVVQS